MNYIIYDLEWNQPPDESSLVTDPICLEGEIIEIGAVKLDEKFQIVDEFRCYVNPKFYKKLHSRIASLTKIRDRVLAEQGVPFPEMYARFMDWCGEDFAFMTWSTSDLPVLMDNMQIHGLDMSNFPECYDIQRIFSREIMRSNTRYSLDTALNILKEKGDAAHDALHDARNTAKVCNHLDLDAYLGEYASPVFADPAPEKIYVNRQELKEDPELKTFPCPWCGQPVTCEGWLPSLGSTMLGYGLCPEEDEFLVELWTRNRPGGQCSARRVIYEMSDDLWDVYMDKKEALGV